MNHSCVKKALQNANITTITRENVNDPICNGFNNPKTLLEFCVSRNCCFEEGVITWLLSMGAKPTENTIIECINDALKIMLEHSSNVNDMKDLIFRDSRFYTDIDRICLFIDYGAPCPTEFLRPKDDAPTIQKIRFYERLSNSHVATSRKSLCALLWCSKRSFIPLRGIILELARSAWAKKGGEGCGPRGHGWLIKLE